MTEKTKLCNLLDLCAQQVEYFSKFMLFGCELN